MVNRRVSDGIELDMGEDEKVIGIEIFDVSKHVAWQNSCLSLDLQTVDDIDRTAKDER